MSYFKWEDPWPGDPQWDVTGLPQSPWEKIPPHVHHLIEQQYQAKWDKEAAAVAYLSDPKGPNLGPPQVKIGTAPGTADFEAADHNQFVKNFAKVVWSKFFPGDKSAWVVPHPAVPYGSTQAVIDYTGAKGPSSLVVTFSKKSTQQTISVNRLQLIKNQWTWVTDPITIVGSPKPMSATQMKAALLHVVWPNGVHIPPIPAGTTKAIVQIPNGADADSSNKISVQMISGTKTTKVYWWKTGAWSVKVGNPFDHHTPQPADTDKLDTPEKLDQFFANMAANPPEDEKGLSPYSDKDEDPAPESCYCNATNFAPCGFCTAQAEADDMQEVDDEEGVVAKPDYQQWGPVPRPELIKVLSQHPWPDQSYTPYLPAKVRMVRVYDGTVGKYGRLTAEFYSHAGLGAYPEFMYAVQWDTALGSYGQWTDDLVMARHPELPASGGVVLAPGETVLSAKDVKNQTFAKGGKIPLAEVIEGTAFGSSVPVVVQAKLKQAYESLIHGQPEPINGDVIVSMTHKTNQYGTVVGVSNVVSKQKIPGYLDGSEGLALTVLSGDLVVGHLDIALSKSEIPPPVVPEGAVKAWIYTHPLQLAYVRVVFDGANPAEVPLADKVWVPSQNAWRPAGWWADNYAQWVQEKNGVSIVDQSWDSEKCEAVRQVLKWLAAQGQLLANPTPDIGSPQFSKNGVTIATPAGQPGVRVLRYKGTKLWEFTWAMGPVDGRWALKESVPWFADGYPEGFSQSKTAVLHGQVLEQEKQKKYDTLLGPLVAHSDLMVVHDGTGSPKPESLLGYWVDKDGWSLLDPSWTVGTKAGVLATMNWIRSLDTLVFASSPGNAIGDMEWLDDITLSLSLHGQEVAEFRWSPGAKQWFLWRGRFMNPNNGKTKQVRANWGDLITLHGGTATQKIWEEEAAYWIKAKLLTSVLGKALRDLLAGVALGPFTSRIAIATAAIKAVKEGKPLPVLYPEQLLTPDVAGSLTYSKKWEFTASGKTWYVFTDKWSTDDYETAQNLITYLTTHKLIPDGILTNLYAPHNIKTSVDNWLSASPVIKYEVAGQLVVILIDKGDGWKPDFEAMANIGDGVKFPLPVAQKSTKEVLPSSVSKVDGGFEFDPAKDTALYKGPVPQKWLVQFKDVQWTVATSSWSQAEGELVGNVLSALEVGFGNGVMENMHELVGSSSGALKMHYKQDGSAVTLTLECKGVVVAVFVPSLIGSQWILGKGEMDGMGHLDFNQHLFASGVKSPFQKGMAAFHQNAPSSLLPPVHEFQSLPSLKATAKVYQVDTPWGQVVIHAPGWSSNSAATAENALLWAVKQSSPPHEGKAFGPGLFLWGFKGGYQGILSYVLYGTEVLKMRWCSEHQVLEPEPGQGLAVHGKNCEVCEKETPGCGCIADPMTPEEALSYAMPIQAKKKYPGIGAALNASLEDPTPPKKYTAELSDMPKPQAWIEAAKKEISEMAEWELTLLGLSGLSPVDAAVKLMEHKKLVGHQERVQKLKDLGEWD